MLGTLVAVLLLALLTGASNNAPSGGNSGQQLATGGRPEAGSALRATAPSGAPATSTTAVPGAPGQPTTTASVTAAAAGDESDSLTVTAGPADRQGVTATPGPDASSTATLEPADTQPTDTTPVDTTPVDTTPPAPSLTRIHGIEQEVLALTNADRASQGVAAVSRDGCLDAEASAWARQMAEAGVMTHSPNAGPSVQGCRGSNAYWGDNIGHWLPCLAASMEDWWMGSPSHRPHILDPVYDVVGIGVWSDPTGRCWFQVFFGS